MGFWSRIFGRATVDATSPRTQATEGSGVVQPSVAFRPTGRPSNLKDYALPTGMGQAVVGESHYQSALRSAAGGRSVQMDGTNWDQAIPVLARLVPEPSNKFDRNAVAVEVGGRKVGYIPAERAADFQRVLLQLESRGLAATCPGSITGGGGRHYGIFLRLADPATIDLFLSAPPNVSPTAATHTVTVTGEESHQDVLAGLDTGTSRMSLATLHPSVVQKGKYAGEFTAEVRMQGERVGALTGPMGKRYQPLIDRAQRTGQVVGCVSFVASTPKGFQVTLLLPSARELEAMVTTG